MLINIFTSYFSIKTSTLGQRTSLTCAVLNSLCVSSVLYPPRLNSSRNHRENNFAAVLAFHPLQELIFPTGGGGGGPVSQISFALCDKYANNQQQTHSHTLPVCWGCAQMCIFMLISSLSVLKRMNAPGTCLLVMILNPALIMLHYAAAFFNPSVALRFQLCAVNLK